MGADPSGLDLVTTTQTYLKRALDLLGLASGDVVTSWEDFERTTSATVPPAGWTASSGGSATLDEPSATARGGIVRVATGATGGSTYTTRTVRRLVNEPRTTKWYFASRFKLNTSVGTDGHMSVGLFGTTASRSLMIGAMAGLSTTHVIAQYDGQNGGSALSLVALDTAWHLVETLGLGDNKIYARIDGGALSEATMTDPAEGLGFGIRVNNGATAADRSIDVDWVFAATTRET